MFFHHRSPLTPEGLGFRDNTLWVGLKKQEVFVVGRTRMLVVGQEILTQMGSKGRFGELMGMRVKVNDREDRGVVNGADLETHLLSV